MDGEEKHCRGCREYLDLNRRHFLRLSGAAAAAAAVPAWLPKVVLADSHDSRRDVLVHVFLPGGCDGLSLCVPYAEDRYYALRPTIAVPRPDSGEANAVTPLNGRFGLAPAMLPLVEAYEARDLLFVHACGSHDPTRSHFDAIKFMGIGVPRPPGSLFTGWLGRHLLTSAPTLAEGALRAVALGFGLPQVLVGGPEAVPVQDPANHDFEGVPETASARRSTLMEMYRAVPDPMRTSALNANRTIELLKAIDFEGYQPAGGAEYPEGELGEGLRSAAALIKAEVGVEVVSVDYGGWDTHDEQGTVEGTMDFHMRNLAGALAAFHLDLDASGVDDVTLLAMSEFGRNVAENGSRGTDHGHGNVMLAMGRRIRGGRVLADWPGLEHEQLYEGQDLAVTIDYRDVVAEILAERLGNGRLAEIFPDPGYTPTFRGVSTGAAVAASETV